ncbi:formate dehydrogenase alpha chain [Dinoroseobacter shibae DFL 12 = DSM 16493]|jgi:formate dehydrogenase major subunit|uniref:Formate dehydrogenase alpha chain n=1 Tax=Dinoroseobacter shibae (strain DSM 16493 / NCIMB 14021 / DFL 12) TaxID=398580 RepID=A8LNU4_DINSH|nr:MULTISPECIES: formate dehydrogenase subunit alpha [Dinoroseobacter]ABV92252.1 formate dehydrogenase alpha chain [Dinoroseobacter shibae DFL 12 = DSM 16493]MDD9717451.1 formate dehydrogenase subunit alpha [Dinoroseobacter sp. PD6]URF47203.1 formate dehydrogenase subunit alpha [Dinoroseobacter shibae]URF51514.1 formate dehydrogenase subunit alpha [Dinoroseobacter shibae]
MLVKRRSTDARRSGLAAFAQNVSAKPVDRRSFLRSSGLAVGGLAALGTVGATTVRRAEAGMTDFSQPVEIKTNICTHCSVGCTVLAEVQNGVWVGQEPAWKSPINRGTHCAKGASVRELVHGDRRLKYPMKKENGAWVRISWDQAIDEIGDKMLDIREKHGADSAYLLGSAKFSNEGAYLFRKFAAFWGTNNVDHQARICHSTTVAGVANTWGYGAMTNSYNDIRNSKTIIFMGSNAAEAHPVSLQHILTGKETNRANVIVIDPRFTRTAAHATDYIRMRPGTDIAVIWGIMWHIFENNWQDQEYIDQRVWGMDQIREAVKAYPPAEVERITGIGEAELRRVAETFATQGPATFIWCMGGTQHTVGTANVRTYCNLLLATGNVGSNGSGANIFRGHCNVQGATDFGLDIGSLPCYYGLSEGGWRHWSRVWEVDYDYLQARFDEVPAKGGRDARDRKANMEMAGIPSTRWFDATTLDAEDVDQRDNIKAMIVFGHGGNTVPRMGDSLKGMNALDLLVVADPHPTTFAALHDRPDNTYLLPISTQFECDGSRTASNRSVQWGEKVVEPIFESDNDYAVIYRLAEKLGFADEMFKNYEMVQGKFSMEPTAESVLREINRGGWSTGYTGQSPERLKAHMANQDKFDLVTLRAPADAGDVAGDFYGLPWPCWGTPEFKHPGTHILYNPNVPVKEGGGGFRPRFGLDRDGETLLAEGSYPVGSEIEDGYPQFTYGILQSLGWDSDLTAEELATIQRIGGNDPEAMANVSWSLDLSGGIQRVAIEHGCVPFGNGKARAVAWNLPDPIPVHREPIYSPRPDLVADYPTRDDGRQFRVPNIGHTMQASAVERNLSESFPIVLTSGRLVEYEGGGEETRSNPWLAELQQDMFVEINPADAEARGISDGGWVWVYGPENESKTRVKALVTERVAEGVAFMPFHFAGWFQGEDQRGNYPEGTDPIVLGESVNTVTSYGYDPVTGMHEGKVTLCQIAAA